MTKLVAGPLLGVALLIAIGTAGCGEGWNETRRSRLRGDIDANASRIELSENRIQRLEALHLSDSAACLGRTP